MPRGDGKGPLGHGPMTGGGMGYCAGYDMPGSRSRARSGCGLSVRGRDGFVGRGKCGSGFGRGRRNRYFANGVPGWMVGRYSYCGPRAMDPENESKALEQEASFLEWSLEEVNKRLTELNSKEK